MKKFRDLQTAITLGDIDPEKGVPFLIRRDGKELTVTVKPEQFARHFCDRRRRPEAPRSCSRIRRRGWCSIVMPSFPARRPIGRNRRFCNGDQIVQIDDTPINNYGQINAELARKADQKIAVAVERTEKGRQGKARPAVRRVTIPVEPDPMRDLGLVMEMGPMTAIQADSPAAAAGIQPGDRIARARRRSDDAARPPARQAGKTIELEARAREGQDADTVSVRLREPTEIAPSVFRNSPVAVAALGVAYRVLNRSIASIEGSPAAKAGMKPGDVLVQAKLISPDKQKLRKLGVDPTEDFGAIDVAAILTSATKTTTGRR